MHSVADRLEVSFSRRLLVAACLGLALVLSAVVPSTAARAADGDDSADKTATQPSAISDVTLVKSSRTGEDSGGALTVQDIAKLTYSWDAGSEAHAGSATTIDLGADFTNLEFPASSPMSAIHDGKVEEVGTCVLAEKTITCTFNEKLDELRNAGFSDVKGRGEALLLAAHQTAETNTTMVVNDVSSTVNLPGEGGIKGAGESAYTPWQFSKDGSEIGSSSTDIAWKLDFGSDYVKERLAGGDAAIAADGSTRDTLTFTDTLGDGMSFDSDPSQWSLYARNSAADPASEGAAIATGSSASGAEQTGSSSSSTGSSDTAADPSSSASGFDLTVSTRGQVATVKVTGPFAPSTNYEIVYRTGFTSQTGKAIMGARYANKASLNGSGKEVASERSYVEPFKVTIGMAPGYGGFEVVKSLAGSALGAVPAGTSFDVRVGYKLPAAASTYSGWTAPGTVNDDGVSGSAVMRAEIGKKSIFPGIFPKGTVITLSEDLTSASPAPENYSWSSPTYSVGGAETSSLTIGSQAITSVSLTNRASTVPLGTFQVKQTASGADVAANKEFGFIYDCSDGQFGAVTVKGDDVSAAPDKTFEEGTTCTVSEDEEMAAIDGYDLVTPEPQSVTISTGATATVAFVNTYVAAGTLPKSEPSDSAATSQESAESPAQAAPAPDDPGAIQPTSDGTAPKSSLASTGATVLVPMIVVIVALVAGAVLLMRRRGLKDDDADGVDDADGGTGD